MHFARNSFGRSKHCTGAKEVDDEPTVVEGDVMDVRLGRPGSQLGPELNAPANTDATSRSARSETHAERGLNFSWH